MIKPQDLALRAWSRSKTSAPTLNFEH